MEPHLKTCPDVEITCPFGCSAKLKRSALPTHNKMAAKEHNNLLLAKVCALKRVNAVQNIKMSWKVPGMADKILAAQNSLKHYCSSYFYVPRPGGLDKMHLRFELHGTKAGFFFIISAAQGSSTSVDMSGWKLTVCDPAGQEDTSGTLPEGTKNNIGKGWTVLIADVRRYISSDAITITAEVKLGQTLELEMMQ